MEELLLSVVECTWR